jgi:hypothetical protein
VAQQYVLGDGNVNACPSQSTEVTNEAECATAAGILGYTYLNAQNYYNKGNYSVCHWCGGCGGGIVRFNDMFSSPVSKARWVCTDGFAPLSGVCKLISCPFLHSFFRSFPHHLISWYPGWPGITTFFHKQFLPSVAPTIKSRTWKKMSLISSSCSRRNEIMLAVRPGYLRSRRKCHLALQKLPRGHLPRPAKRH